MLPVVGTYVPSVAVNDDDVSAVLVPSITWDTVDCNEVCAVLVNI